MILSSEKLIVSTCCEYFYVRQTYIFILEIQKIIIALHEALISFKNNCLLNFCFCENRNKGRRCTSAIMSSLTNKVSKKLISRKCESLTAQMRSEKKSARVMRVRPSLCL